MITMPSVIQDYKEGNSLGLSLETFTKTNPDHQLANTMKLIYQVLINPELFEENIVKINQLDYCKFEVEEQLLFLEYLFSLYAGVGRHSNAASILSIIKSLTSTKLSIEFQSLPINMEGLLNSNNGNKKSRTIAFEKCLEMLKGKSKRYKVILWDYMIHLCFTNDFERIDKNIELLKIEMLGTQIEKRYDFVLLLNDCERCQWGKIEAHIKRIQEDSILAKFCQSTLSKEAKRCNVFQHQDESILDKKNSADWQFLSILCLIKKEKTEALKWARKYAESSITYKSATSDAYCLLRAELANNNANAADFFLENKIKVGNESVFDDFFKFRIHRLKSNFEMAQIYFNKFISSVDQFDLHARFDMELQLSAELPMKDLRAYINNSYAKMHLTNDIKSMASDKTFATGKYKLIQKDGLQNIIGEHPSILQVKELIKKFSSVDLSVLIIGETGTGKELVAKALWQFGEYKSKKFIPINCGALSDHLLQSELFGHKKGAFTGAIQDHKGIFEEAGEGIVFLDEIGEISQAMQVSLLRVLESREYRAVGGTETKTLKCKVIFATNRILTEQVSKGLFRQDLQYRIDRLSIQLPALRERPSDIPLLINHFLNESNSNLPPIYFDKKALEHLKSLKWEGNIRELRNEMERTRLFHSDKSKIFISDLSEKYKTIKKTIAPNHKPSTTKTDDGLLNLKSKFRKLDELKKLFENYGKLSRTEAASLLKISLNTAANYLNMLEKENYIQKVIPMDSVKTHYYEMTQNA
jgi:DNA-binding NtrC family response regulator